VYFGYDSIVNLAPKIAAFIRYLWLSNRHSQLSRGSSSSVPVPRILSGVFRGKNDALVLVQKPLISTRGLLIEVHGAGPREFVQ
jgi:hypothetical protein